VPDRLRGLGPRTYSPWLRTANRSQPMIQDPREAMDRGKAQIAQQSVTPGFRRRARNTASRLEAAVQGADGPVRLRLSGAVTCGCGEAAGVLAVASVPAAEPEMLRCISGLGAGAVESGFESHFLDPRSATRRQDFCGSKTSLCDLASSIYPRRASQSKSPEPQLSGDLTKAHGWKLQIAIDPRVAKSQEGSRTGS
jgi:hypothetical protein